MWDVELFQGNVPTQSDKAPDKLSVILDNTGSVYPTPKDHDQEEMQLNLIRSNVSNLLSVGVGSLADYGSHSDVDVRIGLPISTSVLTSDIDALERNLVSNRIEELNKKFLEEYSKYVKYARGLEELAKSKAKQAIVSIATLSYQKIAVELTPNKSLFFNILLTKNKNVHIEVFFDLDEDQSHEAFYSLIENRKLIQSGVGTIKGLVDQVSILINK